MLGTIAEDVKKLAGFAEMCFRGLLLHHAPLGERPPARLKTPARADRLRHGVKRRVATDLLEYRFVSPRTSTYLLPDSYRPCQFSEGLST